MLFTSSSQAGQPINNHKKLASAIKEKDSEAVEFALYDSPKHDPEYISLLIQLLPMAWHHSHENIARYLQQLKPHNAVSVLEKVATRKFNYLSYDHSSSLARKCIWALADIGTCEAKMALENLTQCGEKKIQDFASKRLQNWEVEHLRKKPSFLSHCHLKAKRLLKRAITQPIK